MVRPGVDDVAFVVRVTKEGLAFVYVPGAHPDPFIDQRYVPRESRLKVGDTIRVKFDSNLFVASFETVEYSRPIEVIDDRLLVQVSLAVFPSAPGLNNVPLIHSMQIAYSPAFHAVYVPPSCVEWGSPLRNYLYEGWIERMPEEEEVIFKGSAVTWRVVSSRHLVPATSQFELRYMPWYQPSYPAMIRPSAETLKTYKDNYTGVCVFCKGHMAIVWSLYIPVTDIHFSCGGLEGMQMGNWVNFNCEACPRPMNQFCYLEGKKFDVIDPMLPTKVINGCVVIELTVTVPTDLWPEDAQKLVESDYLGEIDLPDSVANDLRGGETLKIRVAKIFPSPPCGSPSWKFLQLVDPDENLMDYESEDVVGTADDPRKESVQRSRGLLVAYSEGIGFLWDADAKDDECVCWDFAKTNAAGPSPKAGMWFSFTKVRGPTCKGCHLCVSGTPVRIEALFETRIHSHCTQIKGLLDWPPLKDRVMSSAVVEGVGTVEVPRNLMSDEAGIRFATSKEGLYEVWLVKLGEVAPWSIAEVIKCVSSRERAGGTVAATEAGEVQAPSLSTLQPDFYSSFPADFSVGDDAQQSAPRDSSGFASEPMISAGRQSGWHLREQLSANRQPASAGDSRRPLAANVSRRQTAPSDGRQRPLADRRSAFDNRQPSAFEGPSANSGRPAAENRQSQPANFQLNADARQSAFGPRAEYTRADSGGQQPAFDARQFAAASRAVAAVLAAGARPREAPTQFARSQPANSGLGSGSVRRAVQGTTAAESDEDYLRRLIKPVFGEERPIVANVPRAHDTSAPTENGGAAENGDGHVDCRALLRDIWELREIRQTLFNRNPTAYTTLKRMFDFGNA